MCPYITKLGIKCSNIDKKHKIIEILFYYMLKKRKNMLDDLDKRILRYLQNDPESSVAKLAEEAATTPSVVSRRLATLQESGYVLGHELVLDWSALGFEVQVSLRVTLDKTEPSAFNDFLREARKIKEVLEIQTFLGMVDVRLSVVARDMEHYQQVYRDFILVLPHISDIEALMHISTIKMDRRLPI